MIAAAAPAARAFTVRGVVQGVGFRPFVHRLAARLGLAGWVRNVNGAVEIEVEGEPAALDAFARALAAEAPPLAQVHEVADRALPPSGRRGFAILRSEATTRGAAMLPADVAMCAACRAELRDPASRRFRWPFITCTDCGPRYSVIESLPYDRERTTLRAFPLCADCRREYEAPGDRRHHAESIACPACGPRCWLERAGGARVEGNAAALAATARVLCEGGIVAVRGMGGFHLAADATDDAAVRRLRARKGREAKPFAVMVGSLDAAARLVHLDGPSAGLLASAARPIVLLPARADHGLAPAVAPDVPTLGVMLPATPLHELLVELVGTPLVMTSGNRSEAPIAAGLEEGRARLAGVADAFLMHDREIAARVDDSVVRPTPRGPVLVRRARGHAPLPLALPVAAPVPLLACGAELKLTVTLAAGATAWPSAHLGDAAHLETLVHADATVGQLAALLAVEPRVAVVDRHPGFLSRRLAERAGIERVLEVQHHHAHAAAVLAEHGRTGPVVALAWDGTGHGDDGHVWGAECLVADLVAYRRAGRLRYTPLPGGDLAARLPWRAALGVAHAAGLEEELAAAWAGIPPREVELAARQAARGLNAPLASSMGRLFDAAAAVLGVRRANRFEGDAAMALEALAGRRPGTPLPFPCREHDGLLVLDPAPLLAALAGARRAGTDVADLAADFHSTVADAGAAMAIRVAEAEGLGTVALGGGTFQNARLLAAVAAALEAAGLEVLLPRALPPGDGAISAGQAAVAAARLAGA